MCLYPRLIFNPKYKRNKKNGGIIPPVLDKRVQYVPIGCQTCIECRKQKAREWQLRLAEDIKEFKNGKFITLTFSTESLRKLYDSYEELRSKKGYDLDNAIVTKATRLFLERWRKEKGKSVRHWLVSELGDGTTEHVHLHGIIWTDDVNDIEKHWQYGNVWKGYEVKGKFENYVNGRTVNYITKYVHKVDELHLNYKPVILCSPGIGRYYEKSGVIKENKYKGEKTNEAYRSSTGHRIGMPIYWRNKIYSEKERELLWLMKLDKNERFVCGERIIIRSKKDEDQYYKLVQYYRNKTERLGYPKPEFIWKKKQYEEQRREMMHDRRIRRIEVNEWGEEVQP
ncbi:MAG: replication initiator protein [Microviridae sp.]|nr:MAG: replication initiator protein [Microviridae sp.]